MKIRKFIVIAAFGAPYASFYPIYAQMGTAKTALPGNYRKAKGERVGRYAGKRPNRHTDGFKRGFLAERSFDRLHDVFRNRYFVHWQSC